MKAYSNCDDVREDFSVLLDGELSPQEQDAVESHLSDCSLCLRELDGLKQIDTLYGELPRIDAPQQFESEVQELLNPKRVMPWPKRARDWRILGGVLAMAAGLAVTIGITLPDNIREQSFYTARTMESQLETASAPASAEMLGGRVAAERELAEEVSFDSFGGLDADDAPKRQLAKLSNRPPGAAFPRENTLDEVVVEGKAKDMLLESDLAPLENPSSVATNAPTLLEQEPLKKESQIRVGDKAFAEPGLAGAFEDAQGTVASAADSLDTSSLADGEADRLTQLQSVAARSESSLGFVAGQEEFRRDVRMRSISPTDLNVTLEKSDAISTLVRNFEVREGVWYERGYADETTITLARDSARWRDILEKMPDLRPLVDVREQVIFRFNELWYSLERVSADK